MNLLNKWGIWRNCNGHYLEQVKTETKKKKRKKER